MDMGAFKPSKKKSIELPEGRKNTLKEYRFTQRKEEQAKDRARDENLG
jgi:hypothetical protein